MPSSRLTGILEELAMTSVLILYYSSYGHTEATEQAAAEGVREALIGGVGRVFTSTGSRHGSQEATLPSIQIVLLHLGMVVAGLARALAAARLEETA
ncbi:hypothetical protein [Labrys neptuniae]